KIWPPASQRCLCLTNKKVDFPDLNSIEHLWVQFGCAICARVTNRTTLAGLQQMLIEEWDTIQQQNMTKLIINVRERCQAVVQRPHQLCRIPFTFSLTLQWQLLEKIVEKL
uniref:Uncharacterized protein n=1 Tax=Xiphophorus maculatus TaxID=8083 RepID=A0A3B5RAE0_XIPMA